MLICHIVCTGCANRSLIGIPRFLVIHTHRHLGKMLTVAIVFKSTQSWFLVTTLVSKYSSGLAFIEICKKLKPQIVDPWKRSLHIFEIVG